MIGPLVQGFMLVGVLYYYSRGMMSLINDYYRDEFKTYLHKEKRPQELSVPKQIEVDKTPTPELIDPTQPTLTQSSENILPPLNDDTLKTDSCNTVEDSIVDRKSVDSVNDSPRRLFNSLTIENSNKIISIPSTSCKRNYEHKIKNQLVSATNAGTFAKTMTNINTGNYHPITSDGISKVKKIAIAVENGYMNSYRAIADHQARSDDIFKWRSGCKPRSVQELVQFWSGNEAVHSNLRTATNVCNIH